MNPGFAIKSTTLTRRFIFAFVIDGSYRSNATHSPLNQARLDNVPFARSLKKKKTHLVYLFISLPNSHIVSMDIALPTHKISTQNAPVIIITSASSSFGQSLVQKVVLLMGSTRVCAYRSPDGWESGKLSCKFYVCSVVLV